MCIRDSFISDTNKVKSSLKFLLIWNSVGILEFLVVENFLKIDYLYLFRLFIVSELTDDITKCCSACFNRIARRLGTGTGPGDQVTQMAPETTDTTGTTLQLHSEHLA